MSLNRRLMTAACVVAVGLSYLFAADICRAADTTDATPEKDWSDPIRHPFDWLTLGADERMREEYLNNAFSLSGHTPNHEWHFERYRTRAWAGITPCENFELYARVLWEGRHYWEPNNKDEWERGDGIIDNLYGKVKNIFGLPVSVTLGRQDIVFGDGWLILEGTPLDASRDIYFDAIRTTVELKNLQTNVDFIYIDQMSRPDRWYRPLNNQHTPLIEQNERGAIVYVTNKSLPKTQIDGYFIYKHDQRVLANGDDGEIYTFGSRIAGQFSDNWIYRVEGAGQFGRRNGADIQGFGANSKLTYAFKDSMDSRLSLSYEFLSGDDPKTKDNEAFDPLWGRWPQWSELYVYTYAPETRIAETTNLHRVALTYDVTPAPRFSINASYMLLFADSNTRAGTSPLFSNGGRFRGQLFVGLLKYRFNRHMSGHLLGEYFLPGNYYAEGHRNGATYLRAELVFEL